MSATQADCQVMWSAFTGFCWDGPARIGHLGSVSSQLMNRHWLRVAAVGAIAMLAATACGSRQEPTATITVYAASSLIKSFTAIGKEFEAANPGIAVGFVFAGSTDLSSSLAEGVDADVFASGDPGHMAVVADAGEASGTPVPFASNRLVVVTAAGNPRKLTSFADLATPGLRVALCSERSSCGSATELVERRPVSSAPTTNRVLDEVTGGRADAGVVYMTDALAAGGRVSWFSVSGDCDAVTSWITVLKSTHQERAAQAFLHEVTGAGGRQILAAAGFSEPPKKSAG
jgi:molybdate transport system substrate-binding protein